MKELNPGKIYYLVEKELIICFSSWKFYAVLIAVAAMEIFLIGRWEKQYTDFLVIITSIYGMNVFLLDLNIKIDKIQGRTPHMLGFGFRAYDIVVGKIIFISFLSVSIASVCLFIYRFTNSVNILKNGHFLVEAILIEFFVIGFSALLYFKFEDPRALVIFLLILLLGLSRIKDFIVKLAESNYFHISIIVVFTGANWLLLEFIKRRKNEFFF